MSRHFIALLVFTVPVLGPALAQDAPPTRFPAIEALEAWKRIPQEQPALPIWARTLVEPLPKATAAFLQLNYLHRAASPVGNVLAGKLRWAAADAIDCDFARRYAEADLRRAGVSDDDLRLLAGDASQWPAADRAVLAFARKLTRAGHEVTDDEVSELVRQFGVEQFVGIVHTVAFANFENRIFLALGISVEQDGPLPPVELRVDADQQREVVVPARRSWDELQLAAPPFLRAARPDWGAQGSTDLGQALDRQKQRGSRIPLPAPERLEVVPPESRARTTRIIWSNVSMGYQPALTKGWFSCMQAFRDESKMDPVFANSVFWVVTRSNECFY